MPRLSKYDSLKRWLQACDRTSVTLTFAKLEEILGFDLPISALKYDSWWANSSTGGSQIRSWRDAGWEVETVDRSGRRVTFRRVSGAPMRSVRRAEGSIPIVTTAKTIASANDKLAGRVTPVHRGTADDDAVKPSLTPITTMSDRPIGLDSRQAREMAEAAMRGEPTGINLPQDLVDAKRLPPQARRLLEVRARRNGRTLSRELTGIIASAVASEKRLLLAELRRLRELTARPGSFDLLNLLGRRD